ncbi:NADH-quinone oxidoreductase subunit C [bacterium]|nr:MAG: NADH-quinone oxidoreductase subunit C [bacterium]
MASIDKIKAALDSALSGAVLGTDSFRGMDALRVDASAIVKICSFLRDNPEFSFEMLTDLTAVDYLGREKRFEVVYHLYSFKYNTRLRLRADLGEGEPIQTVEGVWKAANWLEREVFDLMGITFAGHSDLRRIMMWEGYEGHPLRKDFPLLGIPQKAVYR